MRLIFILFTLLIGTFSNAQCLKADILFLLDWSGSEDSNRVYIPTAAYDFVSNLSLGPSAVKVGVIPFNTDPLIDRCLHLTDDKELVTSLLLSMLTLEPYGSTRFTTSFELANIYFEQSEVERGEPVMRILIFISDGDEMELGREFTQMHALLMKESGTFIWCIATPNAFGNRSAGGAMERMHMQALCSQPHEVYFVEEYYANLRDGLLRLSICP